MQRGFCVNGLIEALLLASALSVDAFVASFSYGNHQIKIPARSMLLMNTGCTVLLGVALWLGDFVSRWLSADITRYLSFGLLLLLGGFKLLDSVTKSLIRRHRSFRRKMGFSFLNFRFVLQIYADPDVADIDQSKTISMMEALSLTVALSLDSLAVGFGAGLGQVAIGMVLLVAFVTNAVAIVLGSLLGEKMANSLPFSLSWLGGVLLMVMAILKLTA